jgi:hypothetical protein
MRVKIFIIFHGTVTSAERVTYLQQNGQYIISLSFGNDEGLGLVLAQAVRDVCAFCSNITHIELPMHFPIAALERMAQALPSLNSVCFKPLACTDAAFKTVVQSIPQLTSIEISEQVDLSSKWPSLLSTLPPGLLHFRMHILDPAFELIDAVTARCPFLRTLMVEGCCDWWSDELLLSIAVRCPYLEAVRIDDGRHLREVGIMALGQTGRLKALEVGTSSSAVERIAPEFFTALGAILPLNPNLHTLAAPVVDNALLHQIAVYATQLRYLSLNSGNEFKPVLNEGLLAVAHSCTLLTMLYVDRVIPDDLLVALGDHCPHLAALVARYCGSVSNVGVRALAEGCKQLREVAAIHRTCFTAPVSMVGVNALATHCPHLRDLEVDQSVLSFAVSANTTLVVGRLHVKVHRSY